MKCNLLNYYFFASLFLGIIDIGFFIYSYVELWTIENKHSLFCISYFNYCFYSSFIFLVNIPVVLSFIFCSRNKPIIPFIFIFLNFISNLVVGIINFVNKPLLCGNECQNHCNELVNYGNNFTIFMITNLTLLGLFFVFSSIIIFKC